MMEKTYFSDMFAAYVAADDTSTTRVDVFSEWRHDSRHGFDPAT